MCIKYVHYYHESFSHANIILCQDLNNNINWFFSQQPDKV